MDKEEIIELIKRYATLVCKEFPVNKIILFGSHLYGTANINSDIDIAVIVDKLKDDFLTTEFQLYKLRRDIDHRLEPLLFEGEEDDSGFLNEIMKQGEVVYSAV